VGIGIPVDLPKRILTLGLNFQFQYMLPTNVTLLKQYPEIQSRKLREAVNRGTTYQALQTVMERRVMFYEHNYRFQHYRQIHTLVRFLFWLRTLTKILQLRQAQRVVWLEDNHKSYLQWQKCVEEVIVACFKVSGICLERMRKKKKWNVTVTAKFARWRCKSTAILRCVNL
jgi:hypothetical protein